MDIFHSVLTLYVSMLGRTCSSLCSGYDTPHRITLPHGDSPYPTQLSTSHQAVPLHQCPPHPSWARPPGARLSLCGHTWPLPLRLQPLFSHCGLSLPHAHTYTSTCSGPANDFCTNCSGKRKDGEEKEAEGP